MAKRASLGVNHLAIALETYRKTRTNPQAVHDVCREYGMAPLNPDRFLNVATEIQEMLFPWQKSLISDNLYSRSMASADRVGWSTSTEPAPERIGVEKVWLWTEEQVWDWILTQLCRHHCGLPAEATFALIIHRFTCEQDPEL